MPYRLENHQTHRRTKRRKPGHTTLAFRLARRYINTLVIQGQIRSHFHVSVLAYLCSTEAADQTLTLCERPVKFR